MEDDEGRVHIVTCRTSGCFNEGVRIEVVEPGDVIVCGVCNIIISDIEPPLLEPAEEVGDDG